MVNWKYYMYIYIYYTYIYIYIHTHIYLYLYLYMITSSDYLNKIPIKTSVATDEGNRRNEM